MNIKTRIVIIFSLVFIALFTLSYQFLNSDIARSLAQEIIADILDRKFNINASFDLIEFEYFPPTVTTSNLKLTFKGERKPFFNTKELKISLRMFQLMLGEITLETITAIQPNLELDISKFQQNANPNTPQKTSLQKKLNKILHWFKIDYLTFYFRGLNVQEGKFHIFNSKDNSFVDIQNVNLDFETSFFSKDQIFGSIETISSNKYNMEDIKLNLGIGKKNIKLYFATLNLFDQPVTLSSGIIRNFISDPTYNISFYSSINLNNLFSYMKKVGDYNGVITIKGEAKGTLKDISVKGEFDTTPLNLNSLHLGKSKAKFLLKNKLLELIKFRTALSNGQIKGHSTLNLDDNLSISGKVEVSNASLEDILDHLGVKDAHVIMPLSGSSEFHGQLQEPFQLTLTPTVYFNSLTVLDSPYTQTNKKQIFYLPAGKITALQTITKRHTKLHNAYIKLKELPSTAKLNVIFPFTNSMYIDGTINKLTLSKLRLLDFKMNGYLSGSLKLHGPFDNLNLFVPITAEKGHFQDIPFDKFTSDIMWFKQDLTFNNFNLQYDSNHLNGNINLFFDKITSININAGIKELKLEDLAKIKTLPTNLKSYLTPFQGKISGQFSAELGEKEKFDFNLLGNNINFNKLAPLSLQLLGKVENDSWDIKKAKLFHKKSFLNAKFKINQENKPIEGSIIGDIYSNDFPEVKKEFGIEDAYFDLFSELSGTWDKPEIEAKITCTPFILFGKPVGGPSTINFSKGKTIFSHGNLFNEKLTFIATGSPREIELTFNFNKYNFGRMFDMALSKAFNKELNLDFLLSAHGSLNFTFNKTYKPSIPSGSILLTSLEMDNGANILLSKKPELISIEKDRIILPEISLRSPSGNVKDHLTFSFNKEKKQIYFNGSAILRSSILQGFIDKNAFSIDSGKFNTVWNLNIQNKQTTWTSTINILNNQFSFWNGSSHLSSTNGKIEILNNQININKIEGNLGTGDFILSGNIALGNTNSLNLDCSLKNTQLQYKDQFNSILDGSLNIMGTKKPYAFTGNLFISKLLYSGNIDWKSTLITRKVKKFLPGKINQDDSLFDLNIAINGKENIFIKNNLADMELKANLILWGPESNPLIKGDIDALGGHFYYQRNIFDVNSFHLHFDDPVRINPYYNIVAQTQIDDIPTPEIGRNLNTDSYLISLSSSGYIANLARNPVVITSSPPLTRSELAILLTFGVLPQNDEQAKSVGEAAVLDILSSQLQEALERETRKAIHGFSIRFDPVYSDDSKASTAAVTLEKNLTDRVTLRGTRLLDDTNTTDSEQEYKLEFRITPNFSVSSGIEDDGKLNDFKETIDFEIRLPFGR